MLLLLATFIALLRMRDTHPIERQRIRTIRDLASLSEKELQKRYVGIGEKKANEIKQVLNTHFDLEMGKRL